MDFSTPGFPVFHYLSEFVCWEGDSIQPSHPVILLSCLQSFPASGSFPMSQFFTSGGQSIGISASASVLPMNIQFWFPLGWTGLISLQSKGLPRVFSSMTVWKHQFLGTQPSLWFNSHICTWLLEKSVFAIQIFAGKVMPLLFNTLLGFVITFLTKSNCLINFVAAVTMLSDFGAQENKISHCFYFLPIYLPWSDGTGCHGLSFLNAKS